MNINTESFVVFNITVFTYHNAQCYISRHHRVITGYLVPYHCRPLTVSKAECKAVPEESKLPSRSLRVKAIDFGGRGFELPRQIHLIYLCSTMISITMQFSASGKRKVNKNILWCMCNMRQQFYCRFSPIKHVRKLNPLSRIMPCFPNASLYIIIIIIVIL